MPPGVSVVICAFTSERLPAMTEAIEALRTGSVAPLEIVLVIDYSSDLLRQAGERWPHLRVIPNAATRGLSGARNTGVAEARGEVVAFLDDDAVPEPDWVERLRDAYADPKVLGVGGSVHPRWLCGQPSWFPDEFAWVVGCTHSGMPATRSPVRNVIGANMSFRREALEEVGGFRQEFGRIEKNAAGAEETDLCIRIGARRPQGQILYDPAVAVEHLVPAARGTIRYFVKRCFGEGRSKAILSRLVGSDSGLSDERAYVRSTLPRGVIRGFRDGATGHPSGLSRAAAIALGLLTTTTGYATARTTPRREGRRGDGGPRAPGPDGHSAQPASPGRRRAPCAGGEQPDRRRRGRCRGAVR